jgi:hypothetical protein
MKDLLQVGVVLNYIPLLFVKEKKIRTMPIITSGPTLYYGPMIGILV